MSPLKLLKFLCLGFFLSNLFPIAVSSAAANQLLAQDDSAPRKKKKKKKKKKKSTEPSNSQEAPIDEGGGDTTTGTAAPKKSLYVSTRPSLFSEGLGIYAVGIAKVSKKQLDLGGAFLTTSSTATITSASGDESVSTSKSSGPGLGAQFILPMGPLTAAPKFSYESKSGTESSDTSDTSTSTSDSTIKFGGEVAFKASPLVDIGLDLTYLSNTDESKTETATSSTKYSALTFGILMGGHSELFEASLKFQPGSKPKATTTVTTEEDSTSSESDKEIGALMQLQGRYKFIPAAFAGLLYETTTAEKVKETRIGFEVGYILAIVQITGMITSDSVTFTGDEDSSTGLKGNSFMASLDFKNTERQTFSIGLASGSGGMSSEYLSYKVSEFSVFGGASLQF